MIKQTIADFPAAKLDELEAKARAATPGPWEFNNDDGYGQDKIYAPECGLIAIGVGDSAEAEDTVKHLAGLDPSTVLSLLAMARGKSAAEERVRELEGLEPASLFRDNVELLKMYRDVLLQRDRAEQERDRLAEALTPFREILDDIELELLPAKADVEIHFLMTAEAARALSSLSLPEKEKAP